MSLTFTETEINKTIIIQDTNTNETINQSCFTLSNGKTACRIGFVNATSGELTSINGTTE